MDNKKILIIGPDFYGYNESVAKAFNRVGFQTDILKFKEGNISIFGVGFIDKVMLKFARKYFTDKYALEVNNQIIDYVNKYNPKVILVIKGSLISKDTLLFIKQKGCKVIMWMMDSIYRESQPMETIGLYDYRFMFEKTDIEKLKSQLGIESYFLPLCYDDTIYFPQEKERDIDLFFVGSFANYEHRVAMFEKLVEVFKDYNIEIYGDYLMPSKPKRYYNYFIKGYKKYFKNRFLSPREVNDLYSRSKIAINIHNKQSNDGCNPRFFEIIGAKTFQLVDDIYYIKKNYSDIAVTYKDFDDLVKKIKHYVNNEQERKDLIELEYDKIAKDNTFVNRINEIVSIAGLE